MKLQTIAITSSTFTEKVLVDLAEFSYEEDTVEYQGLCSPATNSIKLAEHAKLHLKANTSKALAIVYTTGIGRQILPVATSITGSMGNVLTVVDPSGIFVGSILKVQAGALSAVVYVTEILGSAITITPSIAFTPTEILGLTTYSTSLTNPVPLKVLEEFPAQAYEHLNMSCDTLALSYPIEGLASTVSIFSGNTKSTIGAISIPEVTDVVSYPIDMCKITVQGIAVSITELTITIVNTYKELSCMSSEDFSKLLTYKRISGTMVLEGAIKSFPIGYLQVSIADIHGIYIPEIRVTSMKESFIDGVAFTEVSFNVVDNTMSMFFQ